jgi:hypothetical protein
MNSYYSYRDACLEHLTQSGENLMALNVILTNRGYHEEARVSFTVPSNPGMYGLHSLTKNPTTFPSIFFFFFLPVILDEHPRTYAVFTLSESEKLGCDMFL